jgi:hypothetical protein
MQKYLSVINRRWRQTLAAGLVLFLVTEIAWNVTRNPNFIPTLLFLGAFTVPVVFVAHIYEYEFLNVKRIRRRATCYNSSGKSSRSRQPVGHYPAHFSIIEDANRMIPIRKTKRTPVSVKGEIWNL